MKLKFITIFSLFIIAIFTGLKTNAQRTDDVFGQNRMQFQVFDWKYVDSLHFRVFFYGNNKEIGNIAINIAETEAADIAQKLKKYTDFKSNLVVYTTFDDYEQSNINSSDDQLFLNNIGKVKIAGSVFPVYYNGNVDLLHQQIKRALVRGNVEKLIYGSQIKNLTKSVLSTELPSWFTEGFIQHMSDSLTQLDILKIQTYFTNHKKINFYKMAYAYPELTGKSMWEYLIITYGNQKALSYLKKSIGLKNYNGASKIVYKQKWKKVVKGWREYWKNNLEIYEKENPFTDTITPFATLKEKELSTLSDMTASPLFNDFTYVKKLPASWSVNLYNDKNKNFVLLDGPIYGYYQEKDPSNPLTAWSNNGQKLAILYYYNGKYKLKIYNSLTRQFGTYSIKSKLFDKILSINFTESNDNILVSAIKKGQSNIFIYNITQKRAYNITRDNYNNLMPFYMYGKYHKGLVFLSNRNNMDIMVKSQNVGNFENEAFNVFYLDAINNSQELQQLTFFKSGTISNLIQLGEKAISFFIDSNNVRKRYVVEFVKRDFKKDTFKMYELPSNDYLLSQQYIIHEQKLAEFTYKNGAIKGIKRDIDVALLDTLYNPFIEEMQAKIRNSKPANPLDTLNDEKFGNFFNSEYFDNNQVGNIINYTEQENEANASTSSIKRRLKVSGYKSNFKLEQADFGLNNTMLFNRFQSVSATQGYGFVNPTLDGMMSYKIKDILEDYTIQGGFKINTSLNGTDVYMKFINKKNIIDWSVLGYRKSQPMSDNNKLRMYIFEGEGKYNLNALHRVALNIGFRYDENAPQYVSSSNIGKGIESKKWLYGHAEYVFDKSFSPETNIWKGEKFKIYGDYYQSFNKDNMHIANLGFDARAYLPLYRNIIWANRWSAACSYGTAYMLYYMGGVDNPLATGKANAPFSPGGMSNLFNKNTYVDPSVNYQFQTTVAPMRGVKQNTRNGNGYSLINSEIRVPIYSTISNRPVKSGFLRSLQLVFFGDFGGTWVGDYPKEDNTSSYLITSTTSPNGVVSQRIVRQSKDFMLGFGSGIRAKIWGYYTKVDLGWNTNELGIIPMTHISFGTDF